MTGRLTIAALLLVTGVLAGCSLPDPYVFHENEYDRTAEGFGKDPTDITRVTICYASKGATPAQVSALAVEECGRFGKVPVFREQSYLFCPLTTPTAAIFDCVVP